MKTLATLFGLWVMGVGFAALGLGIFAITNGIMAGFAAFLIAPPFILLGAGIMAEQ